MVDQPADDVDQPGPGCRTSHLNVIDQTGQRGKLVHQAHRPGDRVGDRLRRKRLHCTPCRMRGHAFRLPRRLLDHDIRALPIMARTFKSGALPNGTWPQSLREQVPRTVVRVSVVDVAADRALRRRWASPARVLLSVKTSNRRWFLGTDCCRGIGRAQRPVHRRDIDAEDFGVARSDICARDSDCTTAPRSSRGTDSRRSLKRSSTYSSQVE